MPAEVEESNVAATSPTAMTLSEQKPAGKQLEPAHNDVPTDAQDSNAAASQVRYTLITSCHELKTWL